MTMEGDRLEVVTNTACATLSCLLYPSSWPSQPSSIGFFPKAASGSAIPCFFPAQKPSIAPHYLRDKKGLFEPLI